MDKKFTRNGLKFVTLLIVVGGIVYMVQSYGLEQLTSPDELQATILSYGAYAPIAFIATFVSGIIAFLPAYPFTIAGGALFGIKVGLAYAILAQTIGSVISFMMAKHLGRDFVHSLLHHRFDTIHKYDQKLEKHGFVTVLLLRMIPIFHLTGLSFALGLTEVKTSDFTLGTLVGIVPATFAYAYFGGSLSSLTAWNIILAGSILLVLLMSPIIYKKYSGKSLLVGRQDS